MPRPTPPRLLFAVPTRLLVLLLAGVLTAACDGGGPGGDPQAQARSSICPQARGGLAVYWDWSNGVFHPLDEIPTPGGGWQVFAHPDYPPLGFQHPPSWRAQTLRAQQSAGVDLVRGDGAARWQWISTWGDVRPGARGILNSYLQSVQRSLGAEGQPQVVCTRQNAATPAPGIAQEISTMAVTVGGSTIVAQASITATESLPGGNITLTTAAAPTGEFNREVFATFMPIHFQLFRGRTIQDSDDDGTPDSSDNFPFDPNRQ